MCLIVLLVLPMHCIFFKGKRDDNPFYTKEDAATEARQIHAVSGFMFVIFLWKKRLPYSFRIV